MRKAYPSDISREQFEHIHPLLESARQKTRPRHIELYEAFCAILYLLRTGCQWRALPSDFPKWTTAYFYFRIWSEPREGGSLLEQVLGLFPNHAKAYVFWNLNLCPHPGPPPRGREPFCGRFK